jgi:hypothetical protein
MPGIFPDYPAPIVRAADGGRDLARGRQGWHDCACRVIVVEYKTTLKV